MASVLEDVPHGGRILVIRLRSLGDCVLTTPALRLLKQSRPDLRLAVVVENRFRAIFEGNPDIEALIEPEAGAVRRWRPRLCLNLHGGGRSAMLTAVSGAKWRVGFGHFRKSFVYNVKIPTAQVILKVNGTGFNPISSGALSSYGDNNLDGNTTAGSPTSTLGYH